MWEILVALPGYYCSSHKSSATHSYQCVSYFWCPVVRLPVFGIFKVCTDVYACHCTEGCTNAVRESALKIDCGKRSLAASWNRTQVSIVPGFLVPHCSSELSGCCMCCIFMSCLNLFLASPSDANRCAMPFV